MNIAGFSCSTQTPQGITYSKVPGSETMATLPSISCVGVVNTTDRSVKIAWKTNKPCGGQIRFGADLPYNKSSSFENDLVTNHAVKLTGLAANSTYHYQIISDDAAGNEAISEDKTFVTATPIATGLNISDQAPDINFSTLGGRSVAVSDFRGRKVLLNFWSIYCNDCLQELWLFQEIQQELPEVEVMAANPKEDVKTVKSFTEKLNFSIPIYVDPDGSTGSTYNIHIMPKSFLLDSGGFIRYIQSGSFKSISQLKDALNSY